MRFLVTEKLSPHKFKTPEGYLICTDAVLSRTGKQEYRRCELFGDACNDPDKMINVERTSDEVFSDKAMSSFENKPICIQHPDVDVNSENYNELAVGFVRDIYKGFDNGQPVMLGTLVITNKEAVDDIESGKYKELSCGYDCDISEDDLTQRNIRGNHVALCEQGRAGIARIVDSVEANDTYENKEMKMKNTSAVNDEHEYSIWVKNQFGEYKVVTWPAASKEAAVKEFLEMNPRYKKIGLVIAKDSADDTNADDAKFQNLSEQAKKLKEELGLYRQQIGSHKSKGINPYAQRQKGPQVNELNEAINMAIEYLSQGVKDKSAWNRLALKLEAWQDDPECEKIAKRAANAIKKFEAFIADDWSVVEEENYKKANKAIDNEDVVNDDLYGLIKEPDKRYFLAKNFNKKWEIDENIVIIAKNINEAEQKLTRRFPDAYNLREISHADYLRYKRGNVVIDALDKRQIGDKAKYVGSTSAEIHVFKNRDKYEVDVWNRNSLDYDEISKICRKFGVDFEFGRYEYIRIKSANKDAIYKTFATINPAYAVGSWKILDNVTKDSVYTVTYMQNDVTYVRKVRATSLEDAIIKAKDIYNKFEHETDKEYLKSAINEMSRYIRNWPFMTMREKRQISPEGLAALKQTLKFAQLRLAELK